MPNKNSGLELILPSYPFHKKVNGIDNCGQLDNEKYQEICSCDHHRVSEPKNNCLANAFNTFNDFIDSSLNYANSHNGQDQIFNENKGENDLQVHFNQRNGFLCHCQCPSSKEKQ